MSDDKFIWTGAYPPDEWEIGTVNTGDGKPRRFVTYIWRGKFTSLPWLEYLRENAVDRRGETRPKNWRSRLRRFKFYAKQYLHVVIHDPITRKRFFRRRRMINK